jgi:hypothetical protein
MVIDGQLMVQGYGSTRSLLTSQAGFSDGCCGYHILCIMFVCLFHVPQSVAPGRSAAYIDLIRADWGGFHTGLTGLALIWAHWAGSHMGSQSSPDTS